jgi:hypothetical protein
MVGVPHAVLDPIISNDADAFGNCLRFAPTDPASGSLFRVAKNQTGLPFTHLHHVDGCYRIERAQQGSAAADSFIISTGREHDHIELRWPIQEAFPRSVEAL